MYRRVLHRRYWKKRVSILILILACLLSLTWFLGRSTFDFFHRDRQYREILEETAQRHGIDPCLIAAVVWRESRFRKDQVGAAGEIGLMQITAGAVEDWRRGTGRTEPLCPGVLFDPHVNMEIGTWYLARALRHWQRKGYAHFERMALCEYNAGRSRMNRWLPPDPDDDFEDRIDISSTRSYAASILEKYYELSSKRETRD
jgi:soluble lytic murein transglycosylase